MIHVWNGWTLTEPQTHPHVIRIPLFSSWLIFIHIEIFTLRLPTRNPRLSAFNGKIADQWYFYRAQVILKEITQTFNYKFALALIYIFPDDLSTKTYAKIVNYPPGPLTYPAWFIAVPRPTRHRCDSLECGIISRSPFFAPYRAKRISSGIALG